MPIATPNRASPLTQDTKANHNAVHQHKTFARGPPRGAIIPRGIPSAPRAAMANASSGGRVGSADPRQPPLPANAATPPTVPGRATINVTTCAGAHARSDATEERAGYAREQKRRPHAVAAAANNVPASDCNNTASTTANAANGATVPSIPVWDLSPRVAMLDALVIHADWSEACSEFVPRALAVLNAHPALQAGGTLAIHVDAQPALCAYYGVRGIPCIIFRAQPIARSWRVRGVPRPCEVPDTRIVGACADDVLSVRIDEAVAAFCRAIPKTGSGDG